jgi:hypothetical protein
MKASPTTKLAPGASEAPSGSATKKLRQGGKKRTGAGAGPQAGRLPH